MEIYLSALVEVVNVIESLENIITGSNKNSGEIYNVVKDISAIHGSNCDKNLSLKYFE